MNATLVPPDEIRRLFALADSWRDVGEGGPGITDLLEMAVRVSGASAAMLCGGDGDSQRCLALAVGNAMAEHDQGAGAPAEGAGWAVRVPVSCEGGQDNLWLVLLAREAPAWSARVEANTRSIAAAIATHRELQHARQQARVAEEARERLEHEHQAIEATLRSSETRYRMLFAQNPAPMWVYDLETLRFLAVNAAAIEHYGYTEAEFLGMQITDIRDPAEYPALRRALSELQPGFRQVTRTRHRRKDGRVLDVEVVGDAIVLDGRLARLILASDVTARVAADRMRHESDERYALAVSGSTAGLWDWNLLTNDVFYSERYKELISGSGVEMTADFAMFDRTLHPEDRPAVMAAIQAHLSSDRIPYDIDYRLGSAQSGYRWFNARGQALWNEHGVAYRMAGSIIDITDRRLADDALRESEQRFRLLARAVNDAIWDWDLATDTIWWNEGYYSLFGYTPADTPAGADSWRLRIVEEDRERVMRHVDQAIHSGAESWSDEYRFLRADGSHAYVLDRGYLIRDANARVIRMIGGMTDLTERRRAEERIAEQAALLNEAQDAILLTDLEHRVQLWNSGAERLYGWSTQEALGLPDTDLHQPATDATRAAHESVIESGRWEGMLEHRTRDGRVVAVESRWALTRDRAGAPRSILVFNTDVTVRKRNEAQLLRAQRMESIGTLAGGIAHDLNNLLAPMMMSVELLREAITDEDTSELLRTVQVSAERGAALVQQVLSFARGVEGQRVPLSPVLLVHELRKIIRDSFPKSVRVSVAHADDVWSVSGDPTQLHQVLLNLCVNARDAMPDGGSLGIVVENALVDDALAATHTEARRGDYVMIAVTDTGTGIPPETRDRIFEPFFSTKDVGKGTGLGLSTSLAIVRSHGGFILLYSEPGVGTTFRVYLPANRAGLVMHAEQVTVPVMAEGAGELILVVDDETAIRRVAQRTLERYGYRVVTAGDGAEALSIYAARSGEIDLVLTDMAMPVMDGPALITALRAINANVQVVGSSGLASVEGVERSTGAPIAHFVSKPYTADALLTVIRAVLKRDTDA